MDGAGTGDEVTSLELEIVMVASAEPEGEKKPGRLVVPQVE